MIVRTRSVPKQYHVTIKLSRRRAKELKIAELVASCNETVVSVVCNHCRFQKSILANLHMCRWAFWTRAEKAFCYVIASSQRARYLGSGLLRGKSPSVNVICTPAWTNLRLQQNVNRDAPLLAISPGPSRSCCLFAMLPFPVPWGPLPCFGPSLPNNG